MAIEPGAVVQAKYDLTRSIFETKRVYPLVAGTNIAEEGSIMVATAGTSTISASVSTGAAGEVPIGVNLLSFIKGTTFTKYEAGTIPSAAAYTFQLNKTNLIDVGAGVAEAYVVSSVTGVLAVVAGAAPAGGQVGIVPATGLMTFNVAQAGETFWIRYRYNMTVVERDNLIRASHVNRGADEQYERTSIACGRCRIFTTNYDARGVWTLLLQSGAGNSPCLGAGGRLSTIALTAGATALGRIIKLPDADDPYLGWEFRTDFA